MAGDMGEIVTGGQGAVPARLRTTALPAERIGKISYQARQSVVESRHVTYQQKTHVFGHISPTVGATWDGYGSVYGGGGTIRSNSESVVQVVYCDAEDCENTVELPASVSARDGTILRLDHMNGRLFAVQNLSGRQQMRGLLGPADFIPIMRATKGVIALAVIAVLLLLSGHLVAALVLGAYPAFFVYRRITTDRERKELGLYMSRALTAA